MRILPAVAALVVAVAAVIGLAAPAQAATPNLVIRDFRIEERAGDNCTTIVNGVIPYDSQATAQFLIDNGAEVRIWLYGDDPTYDDYIGGGYRVPQLFATPSGEIYFHVAITAKPCGSYDEDDSFYDDQDEIYANVSYYSYSTRLANKRTNVWRWFF